MLETQETAPRAERAFLVGVQTIDVPKMEAASLLDELASLGKTQGLEDVGRMMTRVRERNPGYLLGSGKVLEIIAAAKDVQADSIVFDHALSPGQQRNWEKDSGLTVYDRQELILRIFSARARTREASLQVELAQLRYALPRLAHSRDDLIRQRGGRYGTKGSGEQQLELDRRELEKRITEIRDELEDVRKERAVQRKRRERVELPRAAVVGYTNAGKSTLLNAITNADVLVEDKLFATLDPTTRRITLRSGGTLLATDTVGFIRNLPHGLVDAFKSTLEEASEADVLVQVVDAADPEMERHLETTKKVLQEIGAADKPTVLAFNKIDLVPDTSARAGLTLRYPGCVLVSVKTGEGMDSLRERMEAALTAGMREAEYRIPHDKYALVALAHREASIIEETQGDEGTVIRCKLPERLLSRFEEYKIEGNARVPPIQTAQ